MYTYIVQQMGIVLYMVQQSPFPHLYTYMYYLFNDFGYLFTDCQHNETTYLKWQQDKEYFTYR